MPRPPVQRRESCPVDGYFTLAQAEEMLGLRGNGLVRWMKRHGFKIRRVGKYRCISVKQLERYEELTGRSGIPRVNRRPPGWVGIYAAIELAGTCHSFIWKWAQRGEITAVRVGYIQYYDPESIRRCVLKLRDTALPGWVPLIDVCGQADLQSVTRWLKGQGYEVRKYLRPRSGQRILHAEAASLEAWKIYHASYRRGRVLDEDRAHDIRVRRLAGESGSVLAREYGVSPALVRLIALGRAYPEQAAD